ncbi:MAG: aminotransferase class V-fold PLP-dependent enzyme [Bdellovibrionota bacterium]
MIETVTTEGSTWSEIPQKFEAGTPAIAEAIALGVAVDFIESIGIKQIEEHEVKLFDYAYEKFSSENKVTVYGPRTTGGKQVSILTFNVEGMHAHDIATFADQKNIQIRSGHHCAMPALKALGLTATARMSFGIYNTEEDIDRLLDVVRFASKLS